MKNKLKFLTKMSLSRKVNTKWFKIVNLLLCIAIVCTFNIDSIIHAFGGDFNKKTPIYVIDKTGVSYDLFASQMNYSNDLINTDQESKYTIDKYDKSLDEAKEELKDDKDGKIILEFDSSDTDVMTVTMLSKEYVDLSQLTVLNTALNNTKTALTMVKYNISSDELADIYKKVEINREFLDDVKNNTDENMEAIMSTVFPIVILPFFMLSLLLVQMIGAEVNDEKTTRGMEIIISNVSPKIHLAAKVIAGNLFVIIQALLLVCYVGIGFVVRKYTGGAEIASGVGSYVTGMIDKIASTSLMGKLGYVIPLVLVLMVLTFIAYSLVAGILASMTTNIEDFQQVQTPIMIVSLIGYYLAMMAGMFKGSLFIRIFSYIPFISAILSPSLLVLGQIGVVDVLVAIAIMILTLYLLVKYGLRIYKVGILNYSSNGLWKKMFKAMKEEK